MDRCRSRPRRDPAASPAPRLLVSLWLMPMLLTPILLAALSAPAPAAEPAAFELQEVSLIEEAQADKQLASQLLTGQYAFGQRTPNEEVKAYPKLASKNPLYGTLSLGANPLDDSGGVTYHFVLDESEPAKAGTGESSSLLQSLIQGLTGSAASEDSASNYDRLYFDANRDLDLTNDPVLGLMKDPPAGAIPPGMEGRGSAVPIFDYVDVSCDYGPGAGVQKIRLLPRCYVYGRGAAYLMFISTTARKGKIAIGDQQYTALMVQAGRYDRPNTNLYLKAEGDAALPALAWGADRLLCAARTVGEKLYRLTATPTGDKLTVTPYDGDFGTIEVGDGGKDVGKLGVAGLLMAEDGGLFTVGDFSSRYSPKTSPQQRLPVANYRPMMLIVDYGDLQVSLRPNQASAVPGGVPAQPPKFGIAIGKDKPCTLQFSKPPTVKFSSPAEGQTFQPGAEVAIAAMLTEPTYNLMLGGIQDTSRKEQELTIQDEQGKEVKIPRYASLDPTVIITDSSGRQVAGGKMPFG